MAKEDARVTVLSCGGGGGLPVTRVLITSPACLPGTQWLCRLHEQYAQNYSRIFRAAGLPACTGLSSWSEQLKQAEGVALRYSVARCPLHSSLNHSIHTYIFNLTSGGQNLFKATMAQELFVSGRLCLFGEHSDWAGQYRS